MNVCVFPLDIEAPNLQRAVYAKTSTDGCMQLVTGSLSQAQPVNISLRYFFHSSSQPASCGRVQNGQLSLLTNVPAGMTALEFEVDLTNSGLDTRQTVYMTSWLLVDGVAGPCSDPFPLHMSGLVNALHQQAIITFLTHTMCIIHCTHIVAKLCTSILFTVAST